MESKTAEQAVQPDTDKRRVFGLPCRPCNQTSLVVRAACPCGLTWSFANKERYDVDAEFLAFMAEVDRKREEIKCSRSVAFFRGHCSGSYRLVPSLVRETPHPHAEHNLFHECFARANNLLPRDATSWERLAFFQHYGIPTRLLDWTESLAVALFFAVHDNPRSPCLWIVNAFRLNKSNGASKQPRIMMPGLDHVPDYHDCFVRVDDRLDWPYAKPIFIQIPWTSERVRAQSGFFTFHANDVSIEELCPKHFRRVNIPDAAIPGALKFLDNAGINQYTVFPDFVGLAGFLRNRYRV